MFHMSIFSTWYMTSHSIFHFPPSVSVTCRSVVWTPYIHRVAVTGRKESVYWKRRPVTESMESELSIGWRSNKPTRLFHPLRRSDGAAARAFGLLCVGICWVSVTRRLHLALVFIVVCESCNLATLTQWLPIITQRSSFGDTILSHIQLKCLQHVGTVPFSVGQENKHHPEPSEVYASRGR